MGLIPRREVQALARRLGTDRYYKRFMTYDHLVAMLYTVFSRCTSLREVVTGMLACEHRLRHLGLSYVPRRSTLADANCRRDHRVFEAIHGLLYRRYAGALPDSRSQRWMSKLYIIDSTTISLFQEILKNAGPTPLGGKRKGGIKAHTLVKADEDVPRLVRLTAGSTSDRTFMKDIDVPQGSILAFDRGYLNYKRYNEWTQKGITFVTRLHGSAVYDRLETYSVEEEERRRGVESVVRIRMGHATQPDRVEARLIRFKDAGTGRTYDFLTNNFDMAASTIAAIYRQRWQIEILFKRLKQNYPLQYFLGDNVNAIKVQIWCALIADLLLKIVRKWSGRPWAFANLASMVRLHLMTYIDLRSFLSNPEQSLLRQRGADPRTSCLSLFPT